MLRKRSRAMQKERYFSSNAASVPVEKTRSSPFFSVHNLFVSFKGKGKGSWDSVELMRSTTSPSDHKLFSLQSPKSPERSWDCSRVGLGLVNSLSHSESKNILLGPHMRTINTPAPKSAPLASNDYGVSTPLRPRSLFSQLGSLEKMDSFCLTDHKSQPKSDESKNPTLVSAPLLSASPPISIDSIGSLSATEIELSEDYTCIISHGPNPKTTHIFGDCILESYMLDSSKNKQGEEGGGHHWILQSSENSLSLLSPPMVF